MTRISQKRTPAAGGCSRRRLYRESVDLFTGEPLSRILPRWIHGLHRGHTDPENGAGEENARLKCRHANPRRDHELLMEVVAKKVARPAQRRVAARWLREDRACRRRCQADDPGYRDGGRASPIEGRSPCRIRPDASGSRRKPRQASLLRRCAERKGPSVSGTCHLRSPVCGTLGSARSQTHLAWTDGPARKSRKTVAPSSSSLPWILLNSVVPAHGVRLPWFRLGLTDGHERGHEMVTRGFGAPGGIRTPDHCLRRAVLYPAELRAHVWQDG